MTTVPYRVEAFVVRALILMLVAGGSLSATAEAEAQSESKVRVAVMNFENNSYLEVLGKQPRIRRS